MFGHFTLPEDSKPLFDATKWVVTMKSASGNRMWLTERKTWSYLRGQAATFTGQEADDLIRDLKPTDGSRAAPPTKEKAA